MSHLSNAYVIAQFLTHVAGIPATPQRIRQWAARGHIHRRGTGPSGLALYDPAEVLRHARRAEKRRSLRAA